MAADKRPISLRLRGDLSVPDAAPLRAPGVLSALEAGPELAAFLADAEPPAHDTWQLTQKLKDRWRYAQETLRLVRGAPAKLHRLLASGATTDVPDALLDLFWFPDRRSVIPEPNGGGRNGRKPPPPLPAPPRRLVIEGRRGGFVIRAGPGLADAGLPRRVRVRVAYDVEDGDPFRRWSPFDFDLAEDDGEIKVSARGADILSREGNEIVLEITSAEFECQADGFDPNRDLDVRASLLGRAPAGVTGA